MFVFIAKFHSIADVTALKTVRSSQSQAVTQNAEAQEEHHQNMLR